MWSGPIHDKEFISNVLSHVEESEDKYGTAARMKGMLTVAKEVSISGFLRELTWSTQTNAVSGVGHAVLLHAVQGIKPLPLRLPKLGRDCVSFIWDWPCI